MMFIIMAFIIIAGTIAGCCGLFDSKPSNNTSKQPASTSDKLKARNFLANLEPGDAVTVLVKDDTDTKKCFVKSNMPSLKKIELQFKYVNWHTRIYDYSQIEDGLVDLNNLNEIKIDGNEPFLK